MRNKIIYTSILTLLLTVTALITGADVHGVSPMELEVPKVTFTFDDGFYSTFRLARPILASYGYSGTVYITTSYIGQSGFMNWNQVQRLQNSYGWEIGGHSVNHLITEDLSDEAIDYELSHSKNVLNSYGIDAKHFSSPYGSYDKRVLEQVSHYYDTHRGFWERGYLNGVAPDKYSFFVKSVERDVTVEEIKSWIDQSIVEDSWLILVYHDLDRQEYADYQYTTTVKEFKQVVQYVNQKGVSVVSMSEGMNIPVERTVLKQSFDSSDLHGWSADVNTAIANQQYPFYANIGKSLYVPTSADSNMHVLSPTFLVGYGNSYLLSGYINNAGLTSGETGFYVDEYDQYGNWISGQWKGAYYQGNTGYKRDVYTPTSEAVVSARFQIYVTPSVNSYVWLDELQVDVMHTISAEKTNIIESASWTHVTEGGTTIKPDVTFEAMTGVQHAWSDVFSIDTSKTYRWLQNIVSNYTGGEVGWYIDEYDASGNWISGQWKGISSANYSGWMSLDYSPTSDAVVSIRLQYYIDEGTSVQNVTVADNQFFVNE